MYQLLTDDDLLKLLRDGDRESFAQIYERYWEPMFLYSAKVIRSRDDAADIVQEVFVSIWKRRAELMLTSELAPYLFRCVRNLSIKYIHKNILRENFLATLTDSCSTLDGNQRPALELKELETQINAAVSRLPPKMQEVYLLSRRDHCSNKEIAARLGIAETTVKKQMSNALKVIRTNLNHGTVSAVIAFLIARA
jgi:RNA polymerase sigma-70 factor (ECF subfamily)